MPELLNDITNKVLNKLSSEFIYRKLGLCYDYPTKEGVFPLKTLPKADEVCNNKPNTSGKTTGMYDCILNNALLFTGLASRFELGIASEQDDIVFDRLIGGTIRLGTVAPKNVIVRGLTGDGRYFYQESDINSAFLWVFTTWRTVSTAVVAIESQQKLINIISRWIKKISSKNYIIKEGSKPLEIDNSLNKIKLSAIQAICSNLLNNQSLENEFNKNFSESFSLPEKMDPEELLITQIALNTITCIFNENSKITAITLPLMKEIAAKAAKSINCYKDFNADCLTSEFNPDWREFTNDNNSVTPSQKIILNEEESITITIQSILAIIYSNDKDEIQKNKTIIIEVIKNVPWEKLILASSLSPLAEIHAKGIEYKLWDESLFEYNISFKADESLVAEFLEPDYDENNNDKAGHINPPQKKPVIEIPEEEKKQEAKKKKRRRRKPKTAGSNRSSNTQKPNTTNNNTKEGQKTSSENKETSKPQKKRNNRNRRNKKKRNPQEKNTQQPKD